MENKLEEKLKILVESSCLHFAEDIAKPIETVIKALEIIKKLPEEEKQIILNTIYSHTKNEEEYDLLKEILWTD